jgi:outer membrane receptor protein involved in Fe transport
MRKPITLAVSNVIRQQALPALGSLALLMSPNALMAQDQETPKKSLEEVVIVGSQIKGATISEALAVSVINSEDLALMGVDSGDELMDMLPENGQNFFNEAENISGGVNSSRGDVGAFNLRNLGTGNTLVLLNGRRLVNNASYQTEEIGGSFIPVNTVNSQMLPVKGIDRVEILRDGASAIYGADAVAGVVNTVLKNDFEGFNLNLKWTEFDNLPRNDQNVSFEWGKNFNGGRTNVSVFGNLYKRDRVRASDDPRWANSDFSDRVPEDSPWYGLSAWRNDSANSLGGQFDMQGASNEYGASAAGAVDSAGEFQVFPLGSAECQYQLNEYACANADNTPIYRSNSNEFRDISSELTRASLFVNINHEFESGLESFTEILYYDATSNLRRHGSYPSPVKFEVGAANYYNPLGPCDSPNRLPDSIIGTDVPCTGVTLLIDNYRFDEAPRIVDTDVDTYRFLQGFRGTAGEWDWESAVSISRATSHDVTHNRVSNTLMQEALNDPTPAAYNPFSMGINNNIERARIDVYRDNETELKTFDVKFSNNEIMTLPAGPVGFVGGIEWRRESFVDDRDPRLDGTIVAVDLNGVTYPYISDVVNSSPSADSAGSRTVNSAFGELQIPVFENFDLQLAMRWEDFSDVGSTTVGKAAFGWRLFDPLLVRGSWSEGYRVPNLVTVNEGFVARQNSRTDWACEYAKANGNDTLDILDCVNSTQRVAEGSDQLVPEESTNTSFGVVFQPTDNLTVTVDYWSIEKDKTIGLFGEENHMALDLLYRIQAGTGNCSGQTFNEAVVRDDPSADEAAIYEAAGICPAGTAVTVYDKYQNLDKRTVKGHDIGVYYDLETKMGDWSFSYNGSFLDTFEQAAGGAAAELIAAQEAGVLPLDIPIDGFADLLGRDGNQEEKHRAKVSWRKSDFGASLSMNKLGDFYQSSLTLADGTRYVIPSMTTYDATFDYRTKVMDTKTRFRLGVKNVTNERAPLADRYFGYFSDAHRDYGRYMYLDVNMSF